MSSDAGNEEKFISSPLFGAIAFLPFAVLLVGIGLGLLVLIAAPDDDGGDSSAIGGVVIVGVLAVAMVAGLYSTWQCWKDATIRSKRDPAIAHWRSQLWLWPMFAAPVYWLEVVRPDSKNAKTSP